jgi:hypothetical protein
MVDPIHIVDLHLDPNLRWAITHPVELLAMSVTRCLISASFAARVRGDVFQHNSDPTLLPSCCQSPMLRHESGNRIADANKSALQARSSTADSTSIQRCGSIGKIERIGEVAKKWLAIRCNCSITDYDSMQSRQLKPVRDEPQDRGRVIWRVIDESLLGEGRDDYSRNTDAGSKVRIVIEGLMMVLEIGNRRAVAIVKNIFECRAMFQFF